jgi:hypothetical protein
VFGIGGKEAIPSARDDVAVAVEGDDADARVDGLL